MQQVTRDLLASTLDGWFSFLASWNPPGDLGCATSPCCSASPVLAAAGLDSVPHDVAHSLVREVNAVTSMVRVSLDELDAPWQSDAAEILVLSALRDRAAEIRDVLDQCVEPVLENYLRSECERAIANLYSH